MKIGKAPGEFAFRALVNDPHKIGWLLSDIYFFSLDEVKALCPYSGIKWPVEVDQITGAVYCPAPEELE